MAACRTDAPEHISRRGLLQATNSGGMLLVLKSATAAKEPIQHPRYSVTDTSAERQDEVQLIVVVNVDTHALLTFPINVIHCSWALSTKHRSPPGPLPQYKEIVGSRPRLNGKQAGSVRRKRSIHRGTHRLERFPRIWSTKLAESGR